MVSKIKFYLLSIILMMLPALVGAELLCENRNPAVPINTPTADFVLYEDGTTTHTITGLMWMRCSLGQTWNGTTCSREASRYTWAEALQAAQDTQFAGYTDWRLPNFNELFSIVELSCYEPAINAAVFPNTPFGWENRERFWSSSPDAANSGVAWNVRFDNGRVSSSDNDGTGRVRLVRMQESYTLIAGRYLPIEDGSVIRDITTNLEWQRCSVGQIWNDAQQSCEGDASMFTWDDALALTAPGGFRTPDITELRSLVYCSTARPQEFDTDTGCIGSYQSPTIVVQVFPNTPSSSSWFWSSPPNANDSGRAWGVSFGNGHVFSGYDGGNTYRVRLVRARQ